MRVIVMTHNWTVRVPVTFAPTVLRMLVVLLQSEPEKNKMHILNWYRDGGRPNAADSPEYGNLTKLMSFRT
jgi:hypothetical protein